MLNGGLNGCVRQRRHAKCAVLGRLKERVWEPLSSGFIFVGEITDNGCIRKLRQLTCCLAALSGNDFKGSVFAGRHLIKQILDRLLRQRNGLMIYNKIERVLVITKWIFNHYNTDFSLEITSKVQKVSQKYTFTHKLTTKRNFQTPFVF